MKKPNEKEDEYREQIRKFIEADRDRKSRAEHSDQVKLSSLKSSMPMGCWVWLVGLGILGSMLLKWILKTNPNILP